MLTLWFALLTMLIPARTPHGVEIRIPIAVTAGSEESCQRTVAAINTLKAFTIDRPCTPLFEGN